MAGFFLVRPHTSGLIAESYPLLIKQADEENGNDKGKAYRGELWRLVFGIRNLGNKSRVL